MKRTTISAWLVAFAVCAAPLHGQVITTGAGTTWLFSTSVTQALSAPLAPFAGVAVDAQGNVYAAYSGNDIVVRLSPYGALTVVAGNGNAGFSGDGGPAISASLNFPNYLPSGVVLDSAGNLSIAEEFQGAASVILPMPKGERSWTKV